MPRDGRGRCSSFGCFSGASFVPWLPSPLPLPPPQPHARNFPAHPARSAALLVDVILLAKGAKVIPLGEDNRFTVTTVDNYHVVRAEDEDTLTAWLEVLFPFNTVGGGTPDPYGTFILGRGAGAGGRGGLPVGRTGCCQPVCFVDASRSGASGYAPPCRSFPVSRFPSHPEPTQTHPGLPWPMPTGV